MPCVWVFKHEDMLPTWSLIAATQSKPIYQHSIEKFEILSIKRMCGFNANDLIQQKTTKNYTQLFTNAKISALSHAPE